MPADQSRSRPYGAIDAAEALARAVDRQYGLMLMDCPMPQLDGHAAS